MEKNGNSYMVKNKIHTPNGTHLYPVKAVAGEPTYDNINRAKIK